MTEQVSPLRRRMIDDMSIRNMSPNTQKAYIRAALTRYRAAMLARERSSHASAPRAAATAVEKQACSR